MADFGKATMSQLADIAQLSGQLVNQITIKYSTVLNGSTGAEEYSALYDATDFIPLKNNQEIYVTKYRNYMLFDSSKNLILGNGNTTTSNTKIKVTNLPNLAYIRFTVYKQYTSTTMVSYTPIKRFEQYGTFNIKNANVLSGKSIYGFGDSISWGHLAGISYLDYIAENEDMILTKYAANGHTITGDSSVVTSILHDIVNASSTMPDFVVFNGLTNDAYTTITDDPAKLGSITSDYVTTLDTTTFCGSFESICQTLMTKYMGSKILFVAVHHMVSRDKVAQDTLQNLAKQICAKWGIEVVDLYSESGLNTFITAMKNAYTYDAVDANNGNTSTGGSGTHPNNLGYKKILRSINHSKTEGISGNIIMN